MGNFGVSGGYGGYFEKMRTKSMRYYGGSSMAYHAKYSTTMPQILASNALAPSFTLALRGLPLVFTKV